MSVKRFGIDVSRWQAGFDFAKAKSEGAEFAIIKCSQADYKDPQFENHYRAAKAAGIPVGAYHFCTAKSVDAAKREAQTCITAIAGKQFEYPIFLDFENSAGIDYRSLSKDTNTDIIRAFCSALEAAGYWAGFYVNYDFYKNVINGKETAERFSLWLASWSSTVPVECQMWQFGGSTNVIRSNQVAGVVCDQDYAYMDYPSLIKAKGRNGYSKPQTPPKAAQASLKEGDTVRLAAGAPIYGTSNKYAPWVYNATLYVREINGSRVVISTQRTGAVTGAVDVKYLTKA